MKKLYILLVTLVVSLFASNALAYTPPASPAPASWISDTSHVLSDEAHARLDAKLRQINQSSANEIAALILPTLDGADIADVGDTTAKTWGVGKKGLDNGVLVVLAMKERKSRISTGKGVEGDLPDLKTNDILQAARPYLRKGDVEGALGFIFDSSASAIANHKAELAAGKTSGSGSSKPSCQVSQPGSDHSGGLILLLVAGGAIGLVWYLARSSAKRRREEEERERQAREARAQLRQRQIQEREAQRKRDEERDREVRRKQEEARLQREAASKATPVVETPVIRPVAAPRPAPRPVSHTVPSTSTVAAGAAVAAAAALAAAEEESRRHRAEEARRKREREEEEASARRRRERDEEDRRRRDREEEDRRSSSSSSSSFDWGGGSSGGSGGFGGGDSGGGGSSSDW